MANTLKLRAAETYKKFAQHVPSAKPQKEAQVKLGEGTVRVKRATTCANQVQVWRGEPIAVHVPRAGGDTWHVLDVRWQLSRACARHESAQHARSPFDCMAVPIDELPQEVAPANLERVLRQAVTNARSEPIRKALKAATDERNDASERLRGLKARIKGILDCSDRGRAWRLWKRRCG